MLYTMCYDSPVGRLWLAEKEEALVGLWMEGQKYFFGSWKEEAGEEKETEVLQRTRRWLDRYFKGEKPQIEELVLRPAGSEFQKAVWRILCQIPYGEVTTYGEIGRKLAASQGLASMSAQAVGGAVGRNPISIIIPCHRVVGASGSLTGYAGGIQKKVKLLTLEGVNMGSFFVPSKGTAL
jgi:methylated-DNA-[protein]-cysteine S-methyltransferase